MTNKQKSTLRISLIPLAIIIILILGVGYFLMRDEINFQIFNKEPTVRRFSNFPTTVETTAELQRQRKIVTSDQQLNEFLNYVDANGALQFKDKINFDKEIVIAASTDTQDTKGYAIKIKKIYEEKAKKQLLVLVEETVPGDSCEKEPYKNVAVDIVTLSKTDWHIKFERVQKTVECN